MYSIIVGGGRVGLGLAQALLAEGQEVLLIERNKARCELVKEDLGSVVINGDGCEAATLAAAGAERADVFIACTEEDEDNLVACQLARHRFHIDHIIARINYPRNEKLFKLLGFQSTVNAVESLVSGVLQEMSRV